MSPIEQMRAMVEPFRAVAIPLFVKRGLLSEGQDVDSLPIDFIRNWSSKPDKFLRILRFEQCEVEKEREAEAQKARLVQREYEQRIDRLWHRTPAEYREISEAKSPRPKQFKFVAEFLTDPDSPYHNDDFDKCGLRIVGRPGTGKTAAAYGLLSNVVESDWDGCVDIIKSVRFFRMAKAKHLSRETNLEFSATFQHLLTVSLLVLDDLGSEVISAGAQETIYELLDTRTEEQRFTVITSNLDVSGLRRGFGGNADKIERRLRQFFLPVNFDRP